MDCAPDRDLAPGIPAALLEGLNPEQAQAVATLTGPLLVVAGPGSGKTRVLVHRIAALLATGTWASQILAVTFTNKAAAEMRERVAALVGPSTAERMWIATFHSACVRILRYHHDEAGLPRSFSIADAADAAKLVGEVLKEHGMLAGLSPTETKALVRQTHSIISRAKNDNRGPADLAASPFPDVKMTAAVMAAYNDRLAALGAVDFDDILLRTLHLLRSRPEVARRYQQRFTHILVDEYQDTNAVQYEITRLLAASGNLCVVGDADQSIYAFRGADPSVLTRFTDTFPTARVVTLGQNYRSTAAIVEVAQAVIDPNPAVHRAQLRTDNEAGEPVRLYEADSNFAEAEWVVAQIRARGGANSDHAVLVRTNALTRALEQELTRHRIDHQVVGALRFYDRAEVKDALAWLRLVLNPGDALAFERAVTAPKRGIGATTIGSVRAEAAATGTSLVGVLAQRAAGSSAAAAKAAGFLAAFDAVAQAAQHGPAAALTAVADVAGLRAHLQQLGAKELTKAREENLDELISYAAQFVRTGAATDPEARDIATLPGWEQTEAFMENVALVSAAETVTGDDPTADRAMVSLLTMHAAKGKEYRHVYVVGLEDNICPHARALSSGDPADLEEERRLLFVAVSRAQQSLDLSYCRRRVAFNKETFNAPSRFLTDLPATVERVAAARGAFGGPRVTGRHGGFSPLRSPGQPARPLPVSTGPRVRADQVSVGARLRHATLGEGQVTAVDTRTVTVAFDTGTKMLALDLAPLELIA